MACVANIHADVRDLGGRIICHLRFSFFSARRTINSSKSPFMSAEHANQRLFRTVAFAPQYADGRLAAAKRAGRWSSVDNGDFAVICKIFSIRLKKHPREYSSGRLGLLSVVHASSQFWLPVPEVFDRVLPCRWSLLRQSAGGLRKRRWRNLLDQRQEFGKLW